MVEKTKTNSQNNKNENGPKQGEKNQEIRSSLAKNKIKAPPPPTPNRFLVDIVL